MSKYRHDRPPRRVRTSDEQRRARARAQTPWFLRLIDDRNPILWVIFAAIFILTGIVPVIRFFIPA